MKWGKAARKNAGQMLRAGDDYLFEEWVKESRKHVEDQSVGPEAFSKPIINPKLSPAEIARRTAWNRENRRSVDDKTRHRPR